MKVEGTRPVGGVQAIRGRAAHGQSGAFAPEMPTGASDARPAAAVVSGTPVTSVDALIALQEVPDAMGRRARAARRGRDMLDLLDDVRDGLLTGGVSRATLMRLVALVNVEREDFIDPGLAQVLNEIDLRARVELAKLNFDTAG
jgi:hypothetical protein